MCHVIALIIMRFFLQNGGKKTPRDSLKRGKSLHLIVYLHLHAFG